MKRKPQNCRHPQSTPSAVQCTGSSSFPTVEQFCHIHSLWKPGMRPALQSFRNSDPSTSFSYERIARNRKVPNQVNKEHRRRQLWSSSIRTCRLNCEVTHYCDIAWNFFHAEVPGVFFGEKHCALRICFEGSNGELRILLECFKTSSRRYPKETIGTLEWENFLVASRQCPVLQFGLHAWIFGEQLHNYHSPFLLIALFSVPWF